MNRRQGARQRNIAGLLQHAQQKRIDTEQKVEAGLRALVRAGEPITFRRLASVAGVSTAWLYTHPEMKERILRLRSQVPQRAASAAVERASGASKDAMLRILRQRIEELERDRRGLLERIQQLEERAELLYGELYRGHPGRSRPDVGNGTC
jgi:hypothetical protein